MKLLADNKITPQAQEIGKQSLIVNFSWLVLLAEPGHSAATVWFLASAIAMDVCQPDPPDNLGLAGLPVKTRDATPFS